MSARSIWKVVLTSAAGFLVAAIVNATFDYFGMPLGPMIVGLIDPASRVGVQEKNYLQDVLPSRFHNTLPIPNEAPPFPAFSFDNGLCDGVGYREKQIGFLHIMYSDEYTAHGLTASGLRENASCFETRLKTTMNRSEAGFSDAFVVIWHSGPTCRFGRCAIDVVLCCDASTRKVLSVRASRIGLGLGKTRDMRDIVIDDHYVFEWNGQSYEARPAR